MRIKHIQGAAASLIHEGATYEPDEHGYFRVPFELANSLIARRDWEAEPAQVYVAPVEEDAPINEDNPNTEEVDPYEGLTPAEKGALTRQLKAEAAAKAAAK